MKATFIFDLKFADHLVIIDFAKKNAGLTQVFTIGHEWLMIERRTAQIVNYFIGLSAKIRLFYSSLLFKDGVLLHLRKSDFTVLDLGLP